MIGGTIIEKIMAKIIPPTNFRVAKIAIKLATAFPAVIQLLIYEAPILSVDNITEEINNSMAKI